MATQLEKLGPYRILRKLGRGGMGTVYAGVNEHGQTAAIKVLSAGLAAEEGFRERFEVEIETLKKLNHPNIVRLFAYGEEDGHLYYVMELVESTNLEEELAAGRRFNWREVTRFGIDLCKALKHAHDRGVIHRDIKPANLLLTSDGVIKLTDFGIARLFGNSRLTTEGGLIGTAEYMSPEQADGRRVTAQCDLYSLGSVLFALMAGRPPFQSKTLPEMLQLQRYAEPPLLRRFAFDAPEEMERIIARLLEKDPQNRVPNAAILGKQLAAMEHGLSLIQRTADGKTMPPVQSDFTVVAPVNSTQQHQSFDPLGATRIVEAGPVDEVPAGETSAFATANDEALKLEPPTLAPAPVKRFKTVEEEAAEAETKPRFNIAVLLQSVALAACLMLVIAAIWYFLQPPTADALWATIEEKTSSGDALTAARSEIASFLERFPEDERAAVARQYQEEIDLLQAERQFQVRSRQMLKDPEISGIERDYLEAMKYAEIDPQRSMSKLQALVNLYGDDKLPPASQTALDLARRQLERFHEQLDQSLAQRLKLIDQKLNDARSIASSNPSKARTILNSIVTLYGDKSWASERTVRAAELLDTIPNQ